MLGEGATLWPDGVGGADLDRAGTLHPAMLGDDSCEPSPRRDPLPGPLRVFCGGWLTMLQEGDFTALARELSSVSDRFAWGPPDSGSTGDPVGETHVWPPGGPWTGVLRASHFEKVRVSQPEGRRELFASGSGECELSRAEGSPAFKIHPHPPRRNPKDRSCWGTPLGVQATRRSGEGWPGIGRFKKQEQGK